MNRSDSIANLAKALAQAQREIRGAKKDSQNPYFKSKYADLASVMEACREPLAKNGLAVVQCPVNGPDGSITLETVLAHESGEWISSVLTMTPVKADPQGLGSTITYARRYALSAMVGVAAEDDDAAAASGTIGGRRQETGDSKAKKAEPPYSAPSPDHKATSKEQTKAVLERLKQAGNLTRLQAVAAEITPTFKALLTKEDLQTIKDAYREARAACKPATPEQFDAVDALQKELGLENEQIRTALEKLGITAEPLDLNQDEAKTLIDSLEELKSQQIAADQAPWQ